MGICTISGDFPVLLDLHYENSASYKNSDCYIDHAGSVVEKRYTAG